MLASPVQQLDHKPQLTTPVHCEQDRWYSTWHSGTEAAASWQYRQMQPSAWRAPVWAGASGTAFVHAELV